MVHWSKRTALFPWYDAAWLSAFETVKARLGERDKNAQARFEDAFTCLRTPSTFRVKKLQAPISSGQMEGLRSLCRSLTLGKLETHELTEFGRLVAHDLPEVTQIQHSLTALVSELVGEEVEPTYNFLSLYHEGGRLPPHLDDPLAKYTLDLCLDSSVNWPIYLSDPRPWPREGEFQDDNWEESVKREVNFSMHELKPGEGILFSGSAQWHYREAFPKARSGDFCDMVFFHFRPKGSGRLTDPSSWPALFGREDLFPTS